MPEPTPNLSATPRDRRVAVWLAAVTLLGLVLRTLMLGGVFPSADHCQLASGILLKPGYSWMISQPYGLLISLLVKLFVGTASALGVAVTEFLWRLPVALVGAAFVPMCYGFLRRSGCSRQSALWGGALVAVLPVHVDESRYLWGYEVLGAFFLVAELWTLTRFFEKPTFRNGLLASLAAGFYLISHGYIAPFAPCVLAAAFFLARGDGLTMAGRLGRGLKLLVVRLVWFAPLLAAPVYYSSLRHAANKRTRLGFYFFDHIDSYINGAGLLLGALLFAAAAVAIADKAFRRGHARLWAVGGALYLAPFIFGTPPGITAVAGYMLIGICLWLFCFIAVVDRFARNRPGAARVVLAVCFCVTLWSVVETLFMRDAVFDPNMVAADRGDVRPDIGTKAAGYLVRKHCPKATRVLAIHRAIEPPVMYYYFAEFSGRHTSFFDQPLDGPPNTRSARHAFVTFRGIADIVICEESQVAYVAADARFEERAVLHSEGRPRMWIFAVRSDSFPKLGAVDVVALNRAFDREMAWRVSLR